MGTTVFWGAICNMYSGATLHADILLWLYILHRAKRFNSSIAIVLLDSFDVINMGIISSYISITQMLRVIWSLQLFSSFYIFDSFFLPQTLTLPHAKSQCSWPRPKWSPRMETSLKSRRWAPSGTMSWCSLWGWSLWSTPKDWTTGWSRLDTWAVFEYCYNASFLLSFWDVRVITADRTWLARCKQWFITIKSPVTWTITSNKEEKKDVALNYLNRSVHLFLIFLLRLIFFYFTVCFFFFCP